jgi:hypothetical protein
MTLGKPTPAGKRAAKKHGLSTKRRGKRSNGKWTKRTPAIICKALAKNWHISDACFKAGVSYETMRQYRKKDPVFAAMYDEAYETFVGSLREEVRRRAVDGVKKGVYFQGELVATEIVYSDPLLMALLKRHDPSFEPTKRIEKNVNHSGTVHTNLNIAIEALPPEGRAKLRELLVIAKTAGALPSGDSNEED